MCEEYRWTPFFKDRRRLGARHATALIWIVLLILPATAETSITVDKASYTKGELITLSGSTTLTGATVMIRSSLGSAIILEREALIEGDGAFTLTLPLQYSYPKGSWTLRATVTSGDLSETAETTIEVTPSAEAAMLLVTMLSPATGRYQRTESVEISVSVSTAGAPVEGATATTWGPTGDELALNDIGGVYSITVPLEHDAPVGDWDIPVTVTKAVDSTDTSPGLMGGENSLSVSIEKTPLVVKFLEPKVTRFFIEEEIPIKVEATYANGQVVTSTMVKVMINEAIDMELTKNDDGTFSSTYVTSPEDEGFITITAHANDDAENTGKVSISVTVAGKLQWLSRKYLPYVAVVVVFALVMYKITRGGLSARTDRKALEKEYKDTFTKLRKLQEDYFDKGIIDRTTYEKKTVEHETTISKLKRSLLKINVESESLFDEGGHE